MTIPILNRTQVLAVASAESISRGEAYCRQGAVGRKAHRGDTLIAEVEGSQYEPYTVRVTLDAGGVAASSCTCPYNYGGACKHIVAVLLAYVELPEAFLTQPAAEELVAGLNADDLRRLVVAAADEVPGFEAWLAARVAVLPARPAVDISAAGASDVTAAAGASAVGAAAARTSAAHTAEPAPPSPRRRTLVDTRPIEREVHRALQSANPHDWRHGVDAPTVLAPTVERARAFLQHGDGDNALAILEIIYAETVPNYDWLEGECELADFLQDAIAPLVAEAILLAELGAEQKAQIRGRFEEWQGELASYGADEAFNLPLLALERGWSTTTGEDHDHDDQGDEGNEDEADEDGWDSDAGEDQSWRSGWRRSSLADVQLDALEHSGRTDDFLMHTAALGEWRRRVLKLIELGRLDEAVADAEHLTTAPDARRVAQALREAGRLEPALAVAERGLLWDDPAGALGRWLGPIAAQLGRMELAQRAWQVAYDAQPDVAAFQALEDLASADAWPELRERLLVKAETTGTYGPDGAAILLSAGEIDRAIEVADAHPYDERLAAMVADAVLTTRPAWVIRTGTRIAEGQIGKVKSDAYANAVVWLKRVKQAHAAEGTSAEWEAYLRDLKVRDGRKRTLMGMLKGL